MPLTDKQKAKIYDLLITKDAWDLKTWSKGAMKLWDNRYEDDGLISWYDQPDRWPWEQLQSQYNLIAADHSSWYPICTDWQIEELKANIISSMLEDGSITWATNLKKLLAKQTTN